MSWTIFECDRCGLVKMDDAAMVMHSRHCGGEFKSVEVVRAVVTDEMVERGSKKLRDSWPSVTDHSELVRLILRAAFEVKSAS